MDRKQRQQYPLSACLVDAALANTNTSLIDSPPAKPQVSSASPRPSSLAPHSIRFHSLSRSVLGTQGYMEVLAIESQSFTYPWLPSDFSQALSTPGISGIIAEHVPGGIAGIAGFIVINKGDPSLRPRHPRRYIEIINIAVHPDFRRRGIAAALVGKAQQIVIDAAARAANPQFLSAFVWERNTAASAFFSATGWRARGLQRGYYRQSAEMPPEHRDDAAIRFVWRPEREEDGGEGSQGGGAVAEAGQAGLAGGGQGGGWPILARQVLHAPHAPHSPPDRDCDCHDWT